MVRTRGVSKMEYVCDNCGVVLRKGEGTAHFFTQTVAPENAPHARPFWERLPHRIREEDVAGGVKFTVEIHACDAPVCDDAADKAVQDIHERHAEFMAHGLARVLGAGGATPEFFQVSASVFARHPSAKVVLDIAADVARAVDGAARKDGGT